MNNSKLALYEYVRSHLSDFKKETVLGSGGQGKVYKACDNKMCLAVKKGYLTEKEAKYIDTPYKQAALKYGIFIELAASKLINQLIFQGVSPHFVTSYTNDYAERDGICNEKYPYTSLHYIEYIYDSMTWSDWVREPHLIDAWYNAYFQIVSALYSLRKFFNMTHLDLHAENILVKKITPGGFWHYKIEGQDYYVPNLGFRIYIIDFGHAWIPDVFQSWFIRQRYDSRRVNRSFDINELFKSSEGYARSPKEFKKEIKKLIKRLKTNKFSTIIKEFWAERYATKPSQIIEVFDADIKLSTKTVQPELKHLVIQKK
jgi:serine/threonine protein kinase